MRTSSNSENWQVYDIVLCSLALHHFTEEDAVRLLQALPRTDAALCSRLRSAARSVCDCRRLSSHGRAVSRSDDAKLTGASQPRAHFHFANCMRSRNAPAGKIFIIAGFVLRGRRSGWICRKLENADLHDNARSAALRARRTRNGAFLSRRWAHCIAVICELIRIAREAAGLDGEVAVSIFVNPLQFEPGVRF